MNYTEAFKTVRERVRLGHEKHPAYEPGEVRVLMRALRVRINDAATEVGCFRKTVKRWMDFGVREGLFAWEASSAMFRAAERKAANR
jgi:hypothetical protein